MGFEKNKNILVTPIAFLYNVTRSILENIASESKVIRWMADEAKTWPKLVRF